MKKTGTKWIAILFAALMAVSTVFGSAVSVSATGSSIIDGTDKDGTVRTTGTLTINKYDDNNQALQGATFSIYMIANITVGSNSFASIEIVEPYKSSGYLNESDIVDALGEYNTEEIEDLINTLATVTATAIDTQVTDASGQAVFEDLSFGYYLVVETSAPDGYVAGHPFLVSIPSTDNYNNSSLQGTAWVYDVVANPKNSSVAASKDLIGATDEDGDVDSTLGTVAVGDYEHFEITGTIPNYSADAYKAENITYTFKDTMDAGLEVVVDAAHPLQVYVTAADATTYSASDLVASSNYTVTALSKTQKTAAGADAVDLTVNFDGAFIKNNSSKKLWITYYAQVTEDAITGTEGNSNGVTLTYSNQPVKDSTATTDEEKETVYSFDINVIKFADTDPKTLLSGAEFELYKGSIADDNLVGTATTGTDGLLTTEFTQLDEGTYYLVETKSPTGYTLLSSPIEVIITAVKDANGNPDGQFTLTIEGTEVTATYSVGNTYVSAKNVAQYDATAYVAVENYKGFTLPSTGGAGIALFLIVGMAGVIVLSTVMIRKTKKNA